MEEETQFDSLEEYREYVKKRLGTLTPIFAKAATGDFSSNVTIPEEDDEFTDLFAGVEILLEVERKRIAEVEAAKAEVEKEKATDDAILSSIGDGLIVTNVEGKTLLVNQAAEEMLGWKIHELFMKAFDKIIFIEDEKGNTLERDSLPIQKVITEGQGVSQTLLCGRKDSSKVAVSVTATPVRLGDTIKGVVLILRDITKEKEIDHAKTEIVSLASHQLRTPLSIIMWHLDELLRHPDKISEKDQKMYLERIYITTKRMVELVGALLDVSRIELGTMMINPEPTDMYSVVETMISELTQQIIEKQITIKKTYDNSLPKINVDQQLIRIIIQNILSNAVRYMPSGGCIHITLSCDEENFLFKVEDTGYGIPKKQQEKIFSKLFRADNVKMRETEGTGLGLYIVKSILDQTGGAIRFTSEEDKGTTFFITIPRAGMRKKIIEKK